MKWIGGVLLAGVLLLAALIYVNNASGLAPVQPSAR